MNRLALALVTLAIGLALGLTVPPLLAQQPKVQKWQQYCESAKPRGDMLGRINEAAKLAGERGFEIVTTTSTVSGGAMVCYRRPAN